MNPSIIATLKNNDFVKKTYRWGRKRISWFHNMIEGIEYTLTEGRKLRQFKDIYKGERCFIIGNGPSLKMHDLTKLTGEKKFATNMFLLHPDLEKIHLDYYCASDPVNWTVNGSFPLSLRQGFQKLSDCLFFFNRSAVSIVKQIKELCNRQVYFLNVDTSKWVFEGAFSTNVDRRVHVGMSVVIDFCLPLAYYFGFKEVFLLGCDCDYTLNKAPDFSQAYFYDIEQDKRDIGKVRPGGRFYERAGTLEHMAYVFSSYRVAKRVFEADGRKIYNAGYGGKLEVFERVNYDDLF